MLRTIDISNWQSGLDIASTGAQAVICKATQGTTIVDPSCDAHYQKAKALGLKLGVYHYASGGDPIDEANYFVDNIQGYIGEAILCLDWERNQNPRFKEGPDWCLKFLQHVESRTGVKPLIYMSASVVKQFNWSAVVDNGNGLWVAGYPDLRDQWTPPEFTFDIRPWDFVALWQFTNSNGKLDRDIFYGDAEAWDKYARIKNQEVIIAEPEPEPVEVPVEQVTEEEKPVENPKETEVKPVEIVVEQPKENVLNLPQKVYETLRWLVSTVIPAIGVLVLSLNKAWGWGLPEDAIAVSICQINLFLGTIFGISKILHDVKNGSN